MKNLVIGLDFGTDSVRAVLVRSDGGIVASAVHPYARWANGEFCCAARSQYRQHPLDYLEGVEATIREVLRCCDPAAVAGIGIDTTGSTPCAVDRNGTPLSLLPEFSADPDAMFLLWKDHTARREADEINAAAHRPGGVDYTRYEGGIYSSEWFWSKILHVLRHNEKVRSAAFSWVEHCDWITAELTGTTDPLTMKRSRCAAGHKAMWHESWGGLPPEEFFSGIDPLLAGIRDRLYSETFTADVPVGTLTPAWAARLGLSHDVVVAGSAFDCHFGAVGADIRPGQLVKVIGTSTCDIIVAPRVEQCVRGICGQVNGSVVPGLTGLEAGQSAFGDLYAWFKRFLSWAGEVSLPKLEAEAAALPIDPAGVLALDWINGRRTPDANAYLSGALFGLVAGTTAPAVFRALVEATAFGARRIAERFVREGISVDSVVAIGGISRKSPFVMQCCADVMNMPIRVAASDQVCALGGAMFAATAAKLWPDIETAMEKMNSGFDAIYEPIPANVAGYETLYRRYLRYAAATEKEIMADVR